MSMRDDDLAGLPTCAVERLIALRDSYEYHMRAITWWWVWGFFIPLTLLGLITLESLGWLAG